MPRDQDIPQWIPHLADPEPSERVRFAERLYREASHRCLPLLNQWKTDPEFRELLCTRNPPDTNDTDAEPAVIVAGIAVKPDQFEKIRAANDSPRLADVPPDQDAKEFELHFANHVALDILTSGDRASSGAIARFLEKFGEGIQQVEVYVRDVDRATEILRTKFNLQPVYPAPRAGAGGTRVNFLLAPTPRGEKTLIELVEAPTLRF